MSKIIIECKELHKSFISAAETLNVLRGVDFELGSASSMSIIGSSGSGKSTLLSILGGLDRFDSGRVIVGGNDLSSIPEKKMAGFRAGVVGFVFQFHYLLKDFTALENVALPAYMCGMAKCDAWKKSERILSEMGLGTRMGHYPGELSGGERQRTAIARALINDPSILLADEPTGNLDSSNALSVRDLLLSLPGIFGTTLILATHDPELAGAANERYLLKDGILERI
jgi:lipoprotein-releasing system ATP-binding protein